RGTAFARSATPEGWIEIDSTTIDEPGPLNPPVDPYAEGTTGYGLQATGQNKEACAGPSSVARSPSTKVVRFFRQVPAADRERSVIRMPSFEAVRDDPVLYAHASRILHTESNPGNARALVQRHGDIDVWLNPPPLPLTTKEM